MYLKDFDYSLPEKFIAQFPLRQRDHCKLLVVERKTGKLIHARFSDVSSFLNQTDCLVLNNSRVIPARLIGKRKTGGKVEIFLLKRLSDGYSYQALIKPLKRLKLNERIIFNNGTVTAELVNPLEKIVRFNTSNRSRLFGLGQVPLPPYIKRNPRSLDSTQYQTVYAQRDGSVASPTAGLHFTKRLLNSLRKKGVSIDTVTLHINYATFNPVKEDDISKHLMHSEEFSITKNTFKHIRSMKTSGNRIIAVGTTATRVLEATADRMFNPRIQPKRIQETTNLFIYPGYRFKMVDALITNFHLPRSTLFMLVCAFSGTDLIKKAYKEAMRKGYRFYSYGDAMIII
ncbi:tRNA preQ1(34) S-adenosylmethionine ribosyltransferase-isomerase QueA [Candidatus Omnitrophota bacterium]